jgi:transposase
MAGACRLSRHLHRRFVKLMRNTKSPIAEAAVRQIAALYAVEATVRGMSPADRLAARRDFSLPIVEALRHWFEKQLSMISSGSTLAIDIRYLRNLAVYLCDESMRISMRGQVWQVGGR